eukprot:TRINITY_DN388_c0_g2_i2.p1 TRINITY_DN388_c0_g2~~TRINITY_DN388_c0_g2_i2.p1  ORF type:complete len:233 (-),score=15.91 TRINITY_DN388_c0_g2_i2:170-868(-)
MAIRQLASKSCYFVGCFLLIPGSILLLPIYSAKARIGVDIYVAACTFLTLAALIDFVASIWNVLAKPSSTSPVSTTPLMLNGLNGEINADHHTKSPTVLDLFRNHSFLNSVGMVTGGVMFWIASVFYLYPNLTNSGTWVFRFGSFSYTLGTSLSLYDLIVAARTETPSVSLSTKVWISVCIQFILGSLLFVIGGVLSQIGHSGFAVCWLLGSVLFFTGSVGMEFEVVRDHFK